jgi:hypothetical protein
VTQSGKLQKSASGPKWFFEIEKKRKGGQRNRTGNQILQDFEHQTTTRGRGAAISWHVLATTPLTCSGGGVCCGENRTISQRNYKGLASQLTDQTTAEDFRKSH